jgi:hypothetical protein
VANKNTVAAAKNVECFFKIRKIFNKIKEAQTMLIMWALRSSGYSILVMNLAIKQMKNGANGGG